MKIAIAILLLGLTASSFGRDFRTLDYGDECRDVVTRETSIGSTFDSTDEEGSLYMFRGLYEGWTVGIGYWCTVGKFFRGTYIFDRTTFAEATELYRVLKGRFSSALGSPTSDFASAEHRLKVQAIGGEVLPAETFTCFWEVNGTRVHLTVSGPHGGEGWQPSISFEALRRSNNSVEGDAAKPRASR